MGNVYLCGHTGSYNRGCEAIIRSTVGILRESTSQRCKVYSYAPEQDRARSLDEIVDISGYTYSTKILRGIYKYILRDPIRAHTEAYRRIVAKEKPEYMVCVGGDTYCFNDYYGNYAINITGQKYGIPTVLWGCSVDETILHNEPLKRDIQEYRYIVARETLTYEILKKCITPEQSLWLACDPAFRLETTKIELPAVFAKGDTIGINLSPYFIKDTDRDCEQIMKNVQTLISHILEKTQFNICFIPHVYNYERENQDIEVLNFFYQKYRDNSRVSFLKQDLSCTEIKYVISQCRFFIGARTHSMIAAYSTGVPALALSYSVKSLGIAKDIFGTYEGYTLSRADMVQKDCLTDAFFKGIVDREEEIRMRYQAFMPEYKQSILQVAGEIFA